MNSQQSAEQAAQNRQQAAQQALDRLRQANDDMRRASSANASAADARRAADRLREATDALGQLQQQDSGSRLNSMAQTAEQLASRQKQQADRVRSLISDLTSARTSGQQPKYPSAEEVDKMASDRQQAADDLARLTQQMRNAARELASTQPGASNKLRSAISELDENDLGTRLQRSSDQLRTGGFSDEAETAMTNDLQKLGQEMRDAARSLGAAQTASRDADINRAMDNLSRLRDQLSNAMGNPQAGRGQSGQPGGQQAQNRQLQAQQLNRNGQGGQGGQGGQQGGQRAGGQQGGQNGGQQGGQNGGPMGDRLAGPNGNANAGPGGDRNSTVYGNIDTGNTHIQGQAVAPYQGPTPGDNMRDIDQGLSLLNQIRGAVQDDPDARQQLQSLIEGMRHLDPSRFPGNPALVEQMHQQLISGVDALELQLRKQLDASHGGTIRNADSDKIPAGYKDSVAEYYRKLSGGK